MGSFGSVGWSGGGKLGMGTSFLAAGLTGDKNSAGDGTEAWLTFSAGGGGNYEEISRWGEEPIGNNNI